MTNDRGKALIPQGSSGLAPVSRLAERTLAERVEREEQALVATRTLVVGPGGYTTISEAVDAARDGDTVLVRPGTYHESVTVRRTITLRGDGERAQIIISARGAPSLILLGVSSNVANFTIWGGTWSDDPQDDGAIRVLGGAPILEDLTLDQVHGITVGGAAAPSIRRCVLRGSELGRVGVYLFGGASGTVAENDISGFSHAIEASDAGTSPTITRNTIRSTESDGIMVRDGAVGTIEANILVGIEGSAITALEAGSGLVIRANRIHASETGVFVDSGAGVIVETNEIFGSVSAGIQIGQDGGPPPERTDPIVRSNRVADGAALGVLVCNGALGTIEDNEIVGNAMAGIEICGVGTRPLVRANRVHHGGASGILVHQGASGTIEGNEVYGNAGPGIVVKDSGPATQVLTNTIRDGKSNGIVVLDGAVGTIEGNEVFSNGGPGIAIKGAGSAPLIKGNTIRDGKSNGIVVLDGAAGTIEGNEIYRNAAPGVGIKGARAAPLVRKNTIHDGRQAGIWVADGGAGTIEENEIWANASEGILVSGEGSDPIVRRNVVRDGLHHGIHFAPGSRGRLEDNHVFGNGGEDLRITDYASPIVTGTSPLE